MTIMELDLDSEVAFVILMMYVVFVCIVVS